MRWLQLATRIINKASRELPADAVLRNELKSERGLLPEVSRKVTQTVFAYFRWRRWIENEGSTTETIERALKLDQEFVKNPTAISDEELRQRAVPDWTASSVAVSAEWLRALQSHPKIWLRARPGTAGILAEKLGDCEIPLDSISLESLIYRGSKDLFYTPEFQAGEFELQDISSQAVSLACEPQAGQTWWDACAGEGGKTLHLGDLMQNKGLIWASDRADWRLQKLKRRTARARIFNYRAATWDGGEKLPTKTKFDGVLVDAPCSGVGTWQRNPHARWTTTPQDVQELAALQLQLLSRAAPSIKVGGKLIYSVCTLTREETIEVVAKFQEAFPQFRPLPLPSSVTSQPDQTQLWLWPQDCRGNGMFIAAWRREN